MIVSYKSKCKVHGIRKLSHDEKGEGSHDKRVKEYLRWHGLAPILDSSRDGRVSRAWSCDNH